MILYGTKATSIKTGQIRNVDCPDCQTNCSMNYNVFGKYGHVYWIPFFPVDRITLTECNSCKKTFEYKDLPENVKNKFKKEREREPLRYPIWMFTGIFIIIGLFGFGYYSSRQTDADNAQFIKNPKVGDVYHIKLGNGRYTTARVDKVSRTDVYLTNNDYETNLTTGIDEIDVAKNYTTSKDTVSILALQDAFKAESIIEINRLD